MKLTFTLPQIRDPNYCRPDKVIAVQQVLMSMSNGKAVIASDLEGITEVVSDEKTGSVFNRKNIPSLANTLKKTLINRDLLA